MTTPRADIAASTVNWLPRIDFTLDHAVTDVWPLVLDWDKWITDYRREHVSGDRGMVGEINKFIRLEDGGYFLAETVGLIPNARLVYKFLPLEEPFVDIEVIEGYEIFNLHAISKSRTLVEYETVARMESSLLPEADFREKYEHTSTIGSQGWTEKYIPALRELLESSG